MRPGPARSTFAQVAWLLAGAVGLVLAAAALLLRSEALAGGSAQLGPLLQAQIRLYERLHQEIGAQQLLADPQLHQLGLQLRLEAPAAASGSVYPFPSALTAWLRQRAEDPGRYLLAEGDPPRLWVRLGTAPAPWLGIALPPHLRWVRNFALLVLLAAALIAFAAAAWLARRLTTPLATLAAQAPALLQGQPLPAPARASREVLALATALQAAGQAAQARNRERDLLLAGLSHDLRTPLARLRFALELGDGGSAAASAAMIGDVEELDALLQQFIAYARDGSDEPAALLDLADLLPALQASRRQPAHWQFRLPPTLLLRTRPLNLRRALFNLLDNAERHGAAPFEFAVDADPIAGELQIEVRDHGPGVDPALLEALAQPFFRADPARSGPGSGLGLAIVERFARAEGGRLALENAKDGGLCARLVLPWRAA